MLCSYGFCSLFSSPSFPCFIDWELSFSSKILLCVRVWLLSRFYPFMGHAILESKWSWMHAVYSLSTGTFFAFVHIHSRTTPQARTDKISDGFLGIYKQLLYIQCFWKFWRPKSGEAWRLQQLWSSIWLGHKIHWWLASNVYTACLWEWSMQLPLFPRLIKLLPIFREAIINFLRITQFAIPFCFTF